MVREPRIVVCIYNDDIVPEVMFAPWQVVPEIFSDLLIGLLRVFEIIWMHFVNWHYNWIIHRVNHTPENICDYCGQDGDGRLQ